MKTYIGIVPAYPLSMTYSANTTAFDKLDLRNVNYRFDLESDIPWSSLNEAGEHFGPKFCAKVGVD